MSWKSEPADDGGVAIETRMDTGTPTEPRARDNLESDGTRIGFWEAVAENYTDLYEVD
jgi:hypothetical protein